MFALCLNCLGGAPPHTPGSPRVAPAATLTRFASFMTTTATATATATATDIATATAPDAVPPRKSRGGRPKGDPAALRDATIGVRVSASEYALLRDKAQQMHLSPAQWLRQAALLRRLPPPPVPAINRAQYAELARLSANLNQLTHHANAGKSVVIADALLQRLTKEVAALRLGLLGIERSP